jgi:hypothetical protein
MTSNQSNCWRIIIVQHSRSRSNGIVNLFLHAILFGTVSASLGRLSR